MGESSQSSGKEPVKRENTAKSNHWYLTFKRLQSSITTHLVKYQRRYFIYCSTLLLFLILSGLVPLFLSPYSSLESRLVLFIVSLIPIAILVRWDDNRIVLIFSLLLFNLLALSHTIWFPNYYAILTPVFPIFFTYRSFLPDLASFNETGQLLLSIAQYGYWIDLTIVLALAGLISLSSQQVNKVFSSHGRRKVIQVLVVLLMVTTLFVLPYLVILSSGVLHFGLAYGSGAAQLQHGISSTVESGNLSLARPFFWAAAQEYALSEDLFNGLQSLRLFELLQAMDPNLAPLLGNGGTMIEASFRLSDLFIPLIDGIILVENSFGLILENELDERTVGKSTLLLDQSRDRFLTAQIPLMLALALIGTIDIEEFDSALKEQGIGSYRDELRLISNSGVLFNSTLDLVLLQLLPSEPYSFPLDHAINAIFQARVTRQLIGEESRFNEVIPHFQHIVSNLTLVDSSLNTTIYPQYDNMQELALGGISDLIALREQITGIFHFLRDLVAIGLQLGEFGLATAQTLQFINASLVPLVSDLVSLPNIQTETFRDGISLLDQVRTNASDLQIKAGEIEDAVAMMRQQATQGAYGIFSQPAFQVVDLLESFHLQENADNFYHLSSAIYFLFFALTEFQLLHSYSEEIRGNVTTMENNPETATIVIEAIQNITTTLEMVQRSVDFIRANLTLVEYHLNQITNMPEKEMIQSVVEQMQAELASIEEPLTGVIDAISEILEALSAPVDPEMLDQILSQLDRISDAFEKVDTVLDDINVLS